MKIRVRFRPGVTREEAEMVMGSWVGALEWLEGTSMLECIINPACQDVNPELIERVFKQIVLAACNVDLMERIIDRVIREEYGGCHPTFDNPCKIKIRIHREPPYYRCIEYFAVGKWRIPRYYGGNKDIITNKAIMKEVEKILRCNTGKTFEGKEIEWDWQPVYTGE